ncbi:MAG: hypothetical protein ACRC6D_15360 [Aeromonas sp.]
MANTPSFTDTIQQFKQALPAGAKGTYIRRGIVNGVTYFSVIDMVDYLMGYGNKTEANSYWRFVRSNLEKEGFELRRNSTKLKLLSEDGKRYKTECFCLQDSLRIIMSIPSKKVEPLKRFMAKVTEERMAEELNPELAIERGMRGFKAQGKSDEWVEQRVSGICSRKTFTDALDGAGVTGSGYGRCTNAAYVALTGKTSEGLKKELAGKGRFERANVRDHMSILQLRLTEINELMGAKDIKDTEAKGEGQCVNVCKNVGKELSGLWDRASSNIQIE